MLPNHAELAATEQAQREAAWARRGGTLICHTVNPSLRTSTLGHTAAALTAAPSLRPLISARLPAADLGFGSRPLSPDTAVPVDFGAGPAALNECLCRSPAAAASSHQQN